MEHRFRRKWFENTTFCIAVVKLACTVQFSLVLLGGRNDQILLEFECSVLDF